MGGSLGFRVVRRAIRDEANQRWAALGREIAIIARNARSLTLKESAFWAGPSTFFAYGHDIPPPGGTPGLPIGGPMVFPSGGRSSRSFDAPRYADAYSEFREFVADRLDEATTEFGQIRDTLLKIANKYDRMNKIGELNLKEVWTAAQEAKPPSRSITNTQGALEQPVPRRRATSGAVATGSSAPAGPQPAPQQQDGTLLAQNLMPTVQSANRFGQDQPPTGGTVA
jgi:hypothetical protein